MGEANVSYDRWTCERGFVPTQLRFLDGALLDGSNVWILANGEPRSAKGLASVGSSGGASPLHTVGDGHGGMTGGGNITRYLNLFWWAGSGNAVFNGAVQGAGGSSIIIGISGGIPAGLARPAAPTLSDSGVAGRNDGTYAGAVTALRSTTGAESTVSPTSNIVSLTLKKARYTLPAAVAASQTGWGLYATDPGRATTGLLKHLTDVGMVATVDVEWFGSELGRVAPIDYDPPPACSHVASVNNVVCAVGAYGSGIAPSAPGFPEAFPPDLVVFIPGGGTVTFCKAAGIEGAVLIGTKSTLNLLRASGSTISPIDIEQIWGQTGCRTGNALGVFERKLAAMTGQRGAVLGTLDGSYTLIGRGMERFFEDNNFTDANTVVGFDPKTGCWCFASGTKAAMFDEAGGYFHTPMTLPGTAITGATVDGEFLIDCGGGTLYAFERGSGTSWSMTYSYKASPLSMLKHITGLTAWTNAGVTIDILKNLNGSSVQAIASGNPRTPWAKLNVHDIYCYALKVSGSGSGQSVYELESAYVFHEVRT